MLTEAVRITQVENKRLQRAKRVKAAPNSGLSCQVTKSTLAALASAASISWAAST
jgi:hypothetical protein